MKFRYILINKKYYVLNDLKPMLVFYDYLLFRPRIPFFIRWIIPIVNRIVRAFLKFCYFININRLFKSYFFYDRYIIKRIGVGNNPNIIEIYDDDGNLYVIKQFTNKLNYRNELAYLRQFYNNNFYHILLPNYHNNNNKINYQFIPHKTLATEIREGKYSKNEIYNIIDIFLEYLCDFYEHKEKAMIHGDLTPDNVYCIDNVFLLIDFSDSEFYWTNYDKYTFVNRIIDEMYFCKTKKVKLISKYFTNEEISRYEYHLQKKRQRKFDKQI